MRPASLPAGIMATASLCLQSCQSASCPAAKWTFWTHPAVILKRANPTLFFLCLKSLLAFHFSQAWLIKAWKAQHSLTPCHFWPHVLPSPLPTPLQPYWPPCIFFNMSGAVWWLCSGYFSTGSAFPQGIHTANSLISLGLCSNVSSSLTPSLNTFLKIKTSHLSYTSKSPYSPLFFPQSNNHFLK